MPGGDDDRRMVRMIKYPRVVLDRHTEGRTDQANQRRTEPDQETPHPMPGPRRRTMSREMARLGVFTSSSVMKTSHVIVSGSTT